jgi:general secretion pathway protein F
MSSVEGVFSYRAATPHGRVERGTIRADSADAARALLSSRGLFPLELHREQAHDRGATRMRADDLALGLRVLATLLESDLPLTKAMGAMDALVPPAWRSALPAIRDSVRQGSSLAAALAAAPIGIPPVVIGLVQAGEAGGSVAAAVARAAELTERSAASRSAIRAALTYPIILAVAGAGSLALLVGLVLPRFATILSDLGQGLPPAAALVLNVTDAVRTGFLPAGIISAVLFAAWRAWAGTEAGRVHSDAFLLSVPLVGTIRRSAAVGRFAAALSALLESGVPIAPALTHASRAAGDAALAQRILRARVMVVGGARMGASLDEADAATPTAVRLIRAGEETGRLAALLGHAGRLESERAERMVRSLVRVIEPAMILVFGGVVALVAAALLQAVYSMRPTP